MKRSISIMQEFIFDAAEAVVELVPQEVRSLALEVTLLLCAMTTSLTLRSPGAGRIELTLGETDKWAKANSLGPLQLRFELSRNQAEYLQAVLLRAYRDEMAEVNHIHIEAHSDDGPLDLTLLFQVYRPPMSPEDAAKMMDD